MSIYMVYYIFPLDTLPFLPPQDTATQKINL